MGLSAGCGQKAGNPEASKTVGEQAVSEQAETAQSSKTDSGEDIKEERKISQDQVQRRKKRHHLQYR